jgi:hypothetical protein
MFAPFSAAARSCDQPPAGARTSGRRSCFGWGEASFTVGWSSWRRVSAPSCIDDNPLEKVSAIQSGRKELKECVFSPEDPIREIRLGEERHGGD